MSSPPCCPPGSTAALEQPPPFKGEVLNVQAPDSDDSMKVYLSGHRDLASSKGIVVVFSDVFGFDSGRHFQFCDRLAALLNDKGESTEPTFSVIAPDYFLGDPPFVEYNYVPLAISALVSVPGLFSRLRFKGESHFLSPVNNILIPWIESRGVNVPKIGLSWVGFCFGSWQGMKCMSRDDAKERIWRCGVGIHPSTQPEALAGGTNESLVESIRERPILFMPAKNDASYLKPGGSVVSTFSSARNVPEEEISVPFESMSHGFCSRGDPRNDEVSKAQKEAETLAAAFILKHGKALDNCDTAE